jgi:hypothetical protein
MFAWTFLRTYIEQARTSSNGVVAQFFEMLKHLAEPYRTMVRWRNAQDFASAQSWACSEATSTLKRTSSWFSAALSVGGWMRLRRNIQKTTFRSIRVLKDCCWNGDLQRIFQRCRLGLPQSQTGKPYHQKASRNITSTGLPNSSVCRTGSGATRSATSTVLGWTKVAL